MSELPAGFSGKRYNSRKKVAQAHGIPAAAFGKAQKSAQKPARTAPDASAKSGADSFQATSPVCKPDELHDMTSARLINKQDHTEIIHA